jgi:hypothetical protein
MKRLLPLVLLVFLIVGAVSAEAAGATVGVGDDVSYPQCGKALPTGQAFGIVGVNGGLANDFNNCFGTELAWAQSSTGTTAQPKAQLYVNTANPGDVKPPVADWPSSSSSADPYGICTGGDDAPCSWEYGFERASADVSFAGSGTYNWWLDVETVNSWTSSTTKNRADLEGMVYGFAHAGGSVGVYSTASQWKVIVGTVAAGSPLAGLASWLPGARTQAGATGNCKLAPLTVGGRVTLTQWTRGGVDRDHSCV